MPTAMTLPPARPPAEREAARVRQQRYRNRVRDGRRVVPVEVDTAVVEDALVRRGFLQSSDADDPQKVAAALREAVGQLITPPAEPEDTVMHNAVVFRVGP